MKWFRNAFVLLSITLLAGSILMAGCSGGGGGTQNAALSNSNLSGLVFSGGDLTPAFDTNTTAYLAAVGYLGDSVQITPTLSDSGATVTVNGTPTPSGTASSAISLTAGSDTIITVTVTAEDSSTTSYIINAARDASSLFAQEQYIKASNIDAFDEFGISVSLSGDTLAVGAWKEDTPVSEAGAVYVYLRTGTTWAIQQVIRAAAPTNTDNFGFSVSLSGDRLAIGAYNEDGDSNVEDGNNDSTNSGAVYTWTRSGTLWTQEAYIKPNTIDTLDYFGVRVKLSGDTLAIGASGEDSDGSSESNGSSLESGAAYIFTWDGFSWTQRAYLKPTTVEAGAKFGVGLALDGNTLAVGAKLEGGGTSDGNGAVYVFTGSGSNWPEQQKITAQYPGTPDDFFGYSVALSGDTLAIGSYAEDSDGNAEDNTNALNTGAVFIWIRTGDVWTQEAHLKAFIPITAVDNDRFGYSVALSRDTLAIGSFYEDSGSTGINDPTGESDNSHSNPGAVYLYTRTGTAWTREFYIKASNPDSGDQFGNYVALSEDTLVVGAYQENGSGNSIGNSGAVYVFE